jgi:hypothetical protein
MKTYFVSFGTSHNYYNSLQRIKREAENLKIFDEICVYTENDFDEEYLKLHGDFMKNNKSGYGYWIWKSYFVKKTMERMDFNDILIFADCGCHLVNNEIAINRLKSYIQLCDKVKFGNLSFQMCFPERQYTKMDVFEKLDCMNENMLNSGQLVGGIFLLKKCEHTIQLINKYYELCSNYNLIDNSPSKLPNDPSYIDHRHDQSVFSILRKQMGTLTIPDETWFPNFMSSEAQSKPILATRIRM